MRLNRRAITLELLYREGKSEPEKGHYAGGVEEPRHLDELAVWVDTGERFDIETEAFVPTDELQVQISGSRRALFEFGRYLVALANLETADPEYHDHFDQLRRLPGKKECELIVRLRQ